MKTIPQYLGTTDVRKNRVAFQYVSMRCEALYAVLDAYSSRGADAMARTGEMGGDP
jgi:hypothetical protein